jgi:hypothetical protein
LDAGFMYMNFANLINAFLPLCRGSLGHVGGRNEGYQSSNIILNMDTLPPSDPLPAHSEGPRGIRVKSGPLGLSTAAGWLDLVSNLHAIFKVSRNIYGSQASRLRQLKLDQYLMRRTTVKVMNLRTLAC